MKYKEFSNFSNGINRIANISKISTKNNQLEYSGELEEKSEFSDVLDFSDSVLESNGIVISERMFIEIKDMSNENLIITPIKIRKQKDYRFYKLIEFKLDYSDFIDFNQNYFELESILRKDKRVRINIPNRSVFLDKMINISRLNKLTISNNKITLTTKNFDHLLLFRTLKKQILISQELESRLICKDFNGYKIISSPIYSFFSC